MESIFPFIWLSNASFKPFIRYFNILRFWKQSQFPQRRSTIFTRCVADMVWKWIIEKIFSLLQHNRELGMEQRKKRETLQNVSFGTYREHFLILKNKGWFFTLYIFCASYLKLFSLEIKIRKLRRRELEKVIDFLNQTQTTRIRSKLSCSLILYWEKLFVTFSRSFWLNIGAFFWKYHKTEASQNLNKIFGSFCSLCSAAEDFLFIVRSIINITDNQFVFSSSWKPNYEFAIFQI